MARAPISAASAASGQTHRGLDDPSAVAPPPALMPVGGIPLVTAPAADEVRESPVAEVIGAGDPVAELDPGAAVVFVEVAELLDPELDALDDVSEAGVVTLDVAALLDSDDEDDDPLLALDDCELTAHPLLQIDCPAVDQLYPGKMVPLVSSWNGGMMSPHET